MELRAFNAEGFQLRQIHTTLAAEKKFFYDIFFKGVSFFPLPPKIRWAFAYLDRLVESSKTLASESSSDKGVHPIINRISVLQKDNGTTNRVEIAVGEISQIVFLSGKNGKKSFIQKILGLRSLDHLEVFIKEEGGGSEYYYRGFLRKNLFSYLGSAPTFFPGTLEDNLSFYGSTACSDEDIGHALERTGIERKKIGEYSQEEKFILGVVRCLLQKRSYLLWEVEPLYAYSERILKVIDSLKNEKGILMVVSSAYNPLNFYHGKINSDGRDYRSGT
jgi:ABC-type iron transport system FetAB ATPase subunit